MAIEGLEAAKNEQSSPQVCPGTRISWNTGKTETLVEKHEKSWALDPDSGDSHFPRATVEGRAGSQAFQTGGSIFILMPLTHRTTCCSQVGKTRADMQTPTATYRPQACPFPAGGPPSSCVK